MGNARRLRFAVLVPCLAMGCIIVTEGQHAFSERFELADVEAVRLSLPSTPVPVEGCDPQACGDHMEIDGRWLAVAVSEERARELAREGKFEFDVENGYARLAAVRPLHVEDVLDLEVDAVAMPWDRDLEVRTGVGDVAVEAWVASVDIDVDAGDINVDGGDEGVLVRTGNGRIRVETRGVADLLTDEGTVELVQTDLARDATIVTGSGDVFVELASDEDLSLEIRARGRIEVDTERIRTITSGSFSRTTGDGGRRVQITTDYGDVEVVSSTRRDSR